MNIDASKDDSNNKGKDLSKDCSIYAGMYDNKYKEVVMNKDEKEPLSLDERIALKTGCNIDSNNVLQFPKGTAISNVKNIVSSIEELEEKTAKKPINEKMPLHKTLGITDLYGNNRKEYASKETEATYCENGSEKQVYAASTETLSKEKEPPYYKVYMNTVSRVQGISSGVKNAISELAQYMNYDGTIDLNKNRKMKIAETMGITEKSLANYMSKAIASGLIIKRGGGSFAFHPSIFGRGSWEGVKATRNELYNHAVGIVRLEEMKNGDTQQTFEFLDVETARSVLLLMGAKEDALNTVIKAFKSKK